MGRQKIEGGFTIVEMIVTLFVLSLFLTLFFQMYSTNLAQRTSIMRRAAAEDIATSNLNKFAKQGDLPTAPATPACDSSTTGSGNPNNLTINSSAAGSVIASNSWTPETVTAPLSSATTTQELRVLYPKGCSSGPITLLSIVTYKSNGSTESVRRAAFLN